MKLASAHTLLQPLSCTMQVEVELVERFAFYERAKQTFAVVATG